MASGTSLNIHLGHRLSQYLPFPMHWFHLSVSEDQISRRQQSPSLSALCLANTSVALAPSRALFVTMTRGQGNRSSSMVLSCFCRRSLSDQHLENDTYLSTTLVWCDFAYTQLHHKISPTSKIGQKFLQLIWRKMATPNNFKSPMLRTKRMQMNRTQSMLYSTMKALVISMSRKSAPVDRRELSWFILWPMANCMYARSPTSETQDPTHLPLVGRSTKLQDNTSWNHGKSLNIDHTNLFLGLSTSRLWSTTLQCPGTQMSNNS